MKEHIKRITVNVQFLTYTVVAAGAYLLAGASLIAIQLLITPRLADPPISWEPVEPLPAVVCPGERYTRPLLMTIERDGLLFAQRAIRRAAPTVESAKYAYDVYGIDPGQILGDTVIAGTDDTFFYTVIKPDEVPAKLVDADATFTIPNLPPGDYVRLIAAGLVGSNGRVQVRAEPFHIGESCR